ncbi:MAG: LamG domain-containing protein, partial [Deltaproteobacteria bacterium]|nr:LamG domain-containing protein [Deltaproteobacteria bacterium]
MGSRTSRKMVLTSLFALLALFSLVSHASAQMCVQPPSGLVSWWPGDGDANDIVDGNNGTLQNGATFAAGFVGQAFSFDGVDDFVTFGSTVGNFGTSDFTIDFWINTISSGPVGPNIAIEGILGKRPVCADTNFWDIRLLRQGQIEVELDQDSAGTNYINFGGTKSVNDGNFHHVAIVRSGTRVSLYIDGVLDSSGTTSGVTNIGNSASLEAGKSTCTGVDGTEFFTGLLDEIEIYNRALSASEIQAIFAAGSAGKCKEEEPKPDLLIKKTGEPESAYALNDVYQTTPAGEQIESQAVKVGKTATFDVRVENDSDQAQTFVLKAIETDSSGWKVVYKVGATDITEAIHSGYETKELEPGESETITVEMTPESASAVAMMSTTIEAFLDAADEEVRDAVEARALIGLVVNSTGDTSDTKPGDGVCDTGKRTADDQPECTLRAAIEEANATSGEDTVIFAIPSADVPTIQPETALPTITDAVVIDGSTQPVSAMVVLDGSETAGLADGLHVEAQVTVRSVRIQNFEGSGIEATAVNRDVFLQAVEILDNCDWGIWAMQTVTITQWAKVNNNGRRKGCKGGGILSTRGSIVAGNVEFIEVVDNLRHGLQTVAEDSVITLTNATVRDNDGYGIVLDGIHSLLEMFGTQNEVSGNRLSGIVDSGSGQIL